VTPQFRSLGRYLAGVVTVLPLQRIVSFNSPPNPSPGIADPRSPPSPDQGWTPWGLALGLGFTSKCRHPSFPSPHSPLFDVCDHAVVEESDLVLLFIVHLNCRPPFNFHSFLPPFPFPPLLFEAISCCPETCLAISLLLIVCVPFFFNSSRRPLFVFFSPSGISPPSLTPPFTTLFALGHPVSALEPSYSNNPRRHNPFPSVFSSPLPPPPVVAFAHFCLNFLF